MPSPVVHAGLALLLIVGLLGRFYAPKPVMILLGVLLIPELDTLIGLVMAGAHRTLLHNLLLPFGIGLLLVWDTQRDRSWVRGRFGAIGVRIVWVGLVGHVVAGLLLDWAHLEGINLLWPLHDQFFRLDGEMYVSTTEGFVQTFIDIGTDPATGERVVDAGGGGTRFETHVANPVQPSPEPEPGPVDRRFPIAVQGWQLFLVLTGLFSIVAERFQAPDRL